MPDLNDRAWRAADDAVACFRGAPAFEVLEADRIKFQAIYPLAAHTIELVESAQVLVEAGLPYPAEVNGRAAFQHAVTAQWVLLTHNGETDLLAELKRNHSTTVKDFSLSVTLPEDLISAAQEPMTSKGPARDFWQMCARFSRDKALYVLFRRLSDSVHPSLRTFEYHLDADERGVFGLCERSPRDPEPDLLISLAISAMLALSAVESLRRDLARMPEVAAIADRWGVPLDLRGDDLSPQASAPPD